MYLKYLEYFQGTVTEVEKTYCTFKCSNENSTDNYIHMALYVSAMPEVGDSVLLHHLEEPISQRNGKCYFLRSDSEIKYKTQDGFKAGEPKEAPEGNFAALIRKHGFTPEDLYIYHTHYPDFNLYSISWESVEEIKLVILKYLLEVVHVKTQGLIIPIISTPETAHYVEYALDYQKFPPFTQGVHHSRNYEYLVGYLFINSLAIFELTDGKSSTYMKITSPSNGALLDITNKMVIIRKFVCLTETYKGGVNLEYMLCDVSDVYVLQCCPVYAKRHVELLLCEIPPEFVYVQEVHVCIVNVAALNSTPKKTIESWIEVMMIEDEKWCPAYLCVERPHFNILPLLDVGQVYSIYLREKMLLYSDPEIKRIAKTMKTYKLVDGNGVFIKRPDIKCNDLDTRILTLPEMNELMKKHTGGRVHANFVGTISLKMFTKSDLSSRTKREIDSTCFGTPGKKQVHIIRFEPIIGDFKITLYLNNWERKQCPLGLLPNVKLIIRHVEVSKNYLRSNLLTNFQILGYDSPVHFNTANLNSHNPTIFYTRLADGSYMPYGVLVRARTQIRHVRTFKLAFTQEDGLKMTATFYTRDDKGQAFVICTCLSFVKKLLFFGNESMFERWLEVFKSIRHFSMYETDADAVSLPEDERLFHKAMSKCVKVCFRKNVIRVDMLARRIEPKQRTDNGGLPLWFAIDILKNETFESPVF